jgi:hypothetical protein
VVSKEAEAFAEAWIASWNSRDLDRILTHYAPDVEFTSPVVRRLGADASGTLRGLGALRAYFARALALYPDLRFRLLRVADAEEGFTMVYVGVGGVEVEETVVLNAEGRVGRASVRYGR